MTSRQVKAFIKWIVIFNVFFLAGTYIFHSYFYKIINGDWKTGSSIKYILVEFSLANENVTAAWYSSMLFLSLGVLCLFCYLLHKKTFTVKKEKNLSYGWLIFSVVFALLSLDEMASLHERLGNINQLNPLGDYPLGWVYLLAIPIILVIGFMLWFCLLQLKKAPWAAYFAIIALLLFASIPVQEYIEVRQWHAVEDRAGWQRPVVFLIIEEGSELFGATFMIIACLIFAAYTSKPDSKTFSFSIKATLELNKGKLVSQSVVGIIILALLMISIVKNDLLILEGDHGRRENWFPSATAFLTSIICFYLYFKEKHRVFYFTALFSLFVSAYFGGNIYAFLVNPTESVLESIILIILCLFTLALAVWLFLTIKDNYSRFAIIVWAIVVIISFGLFTWYAAALAFLGFSAFLISLIRIIALDIPLAISQPIPNKEIL